MSDDRWEVVELRGYILHPGARETLIDLFDRELVEPQEALGLQVLGQFRDLDDPDCFVWLRGFRDLPSRAPGLAAFYGGLVWRRHRDAANATMIDSDDVLLLRPASSGAGLALDGHERPAPGAPQTEPGLLVVTVYSLSPDAAVAFPGFFEGELRPAVHAAGTEVLACYRTEHGPNAYPALPVREGEEVFVWMARFADAGAHSRWHAALESSASWRDHAAPALEERLERPPEVFRLAPTSRSLVR